MDFTLFGFKFNLLNAAIFLVVGFLVATLTVCSCSKVKSVKEAMDVIKGETKKGEKKKHEQSHSLNMAPAMPMGPAMDNDMMQ